MCAIHGSLLFKHFTNHVKDVKKISIWKFGSFENFIRECVIDKDTTDYSQFSFSLFVFEWFFCFTHFLPTRLYLLCSFCCEVASRITNLCGEFLGIINAFCCAPTTGLGYEQTIQIVNVNFFLLKIFFVLWNFIISAKFVLKLCS